MSVSHAVAETWPPGSRAAAGGCPACTALDGLRQRSTSRRRARGEWRWKRDARVEAMHATADEGAALPAANERQEPKHFFVKQYY